MTILDARCLREKASAHQYLKQALALPEHYGCNLDALYDCLTEPEKREIRFVNLDAAAETYFSKLLSLFQEAQTENPWLHLSYDFD